LRGFRVDRGVVVDRVELRRFARAWLLCTTLLGPLAYAQTYDATGEALSTPVAYPVGAFPYAVAIGDLNSDGKPDLVVGNENGDSVSILLNAGNGTFATAVALPAGDGAQGVAIADLNGDGKKDVVVANLWASTISVLLGNGASGFAAAASYPAGANPHAAAVGDFNGDGKPDIVTADGGGGVSILPGNGNGTFGTRQGFNAGGNPRDLKVADFNADAKLDLAVSNQGTANVSILLGTGTGSFLAPTQYAVGAQPQMLAVGDVNADGKPDLAIPSRDDAKVSLLVGNGDGTFAAAADIALQSAGWATALADMNADGKADLVVARGNESVGIYLGAGNGSFGPVSNALAGDAVEALALADLSGDGRLDVVGVSPRYDRVAVAVMQRPQAVPIAPSSSVDRRSSYDRRKAAIWINRQTSGTYPAGAPYSHVAYGDIDHDGDADFVRTFNVPDALTPVQVMINNGDGSFSDQSATRIIGPQPGVGVARKVLSGDYNADGWPDFFVVPHGPDAPPFPGEYPQLFLSNGNGTLHYAPGLESEVAFFHAGASADIDGDGAEDILLGGEHPFVLVNDGDGSFTRNRSRMPIRANGDPVLFYVSELVDLDGDGFIDLILEEVAPGDVLFNTIFWGGADGLYRDWRKTALPAVPGWDVTLDFAAEDIDRDGRRDIVADRSGSTDGRYLQVLRQVSPRVFADESASRVTMNHALHPMDYIRAQDVNGDGYIDLFIDDKNDVASGEYAWANNGAGVFTPYAGAVVPREPVYVSIDDASLQEGNAGSALMTFTVRLSRATGAPVTFDIATANGSAVTGSDYSALSANAQSIAAGQTTRTFSVAINGDAVIEPNESFLVKVSHVVGAGILDDQATGTITNDDGAMLSVNDVSVNEGDSGTKLMTFTASLSGTSATPVTFDVTTTDGTAVGGADFIAQAGMPQTIPAGMLSRTFSIAIKGETTVEPLEYFYVSLGNVVGANLTDGQGIGYIINNDGALLSINDIAVGEGNAGTKVMTFTVSLSQAAPAPVSYNFSTQLGGDATAGVDYVATTQNNQVIPQGQLSKTHSVVINGDTTIEPTEVLLAYVRQPVGASVWDGQGTGYILNDDGPTLSIPDASVGEGNAGSKLMNVTVQLSQAAATDVTFAIATQDVSANAGDYTGFNLTNQVIPAGQTSKVFQVPVAGDTTVEPNETFLVTLAPNPVGASLYDRQAIATIYNDDGPTLSVNDVSISEGNAGTKVATFTVTLSQAAATAVTYSIATSNLTATAGSDYVAKSLVGESIPAGQLSKTFAVTLNCDTTVEANETFRVTLSNISANATLFKFTGTGTIANDD